MESNILELIHDISTISYVEGVDENNLDKLKLMAIELMSAYAMKKIINRDLWKYPIVNAPGVDAYFTTDKSTQKTSLVIRQDLNNTMHYHFSSAVDIIKAMNHLFETELSKSNASSIKK